MTIDDLKNVAPCYVYNERTIIEACQFLSAELPGVNFLYSIKANPFLPIVKIIAKQNFGADAASLREVESARSCGICSQDIFFPAPGKTENEIRDALGRCVVVADSLNELETIDRILCEENRYEKIGIRVHPSFAFGLGVTNASKFGIDLDQFDDLKRTLRTLKRTKVVGVHIHLRSQILDAWSLGKYYQDVMNTAIELRNTLELELEFINFGSGLGIVYDEAGDRPLDFSVLRDSFRAVCEANKTLNARLIIETGRFVVCKAGRFFTPVVDKKTSHGVRYLIVQNGLNGFLRPAIAALLNNVCSLEKTAGMEPLFTKEPQFEIHSLSSSLEKETVCVVGNLCTALDVVRNNVTLAKTEIGDLIEISNAGSYARTLSPLLFSSHPAPKEYLQKESGELFSDKD